MKFSLTDLFIVVQEEQVEKTVLTQKMVYLPEDEWVHLFTGKCCGGGHVKVECPIGMPPVFYRKNGKYTELFEKVKEFMK